MAKVRIGFSTQFELENELVGIGTDNPTNTLQALGNIRSSNAKAIGVTTLTSYQGFVDSKARIEASAGAKQGATSGEIIIEGEVTVSSGTTFTSGPQSLTVEDNFTLPGISDDEPTIGTMRFNENLASLEFYTGSEWRAVNSYVDINGSRGRGIWFGHFEDTPNVNIGNIDYINMASTGGSTTFGSLNTVEFYGGACASASRGIHFGGHDNPGSPDNMIQYITIASAGDATDFGNLTASVMYNPAGCSSSTRGVRCGGAANPSPNGAVNVMDYIEIASKGDAVDFGDLVIGVRGTTGCGDPTRGLVMGGLSGASPNNVHRNEIQYFTIASKGNTLHFGDLTTHGAYLGAGSNLVRAIRFGSGHPGGTVYANTIDYTNISSTGDATDFGDLLYLTRQSGALSSNIRAFTSGGYNGTDYLNSISYVTIATTGNAIDFGDRTVMSAYHVGCSDSHGGLGGF